MINLLFISDNSKAEYIKTVIQPVLKVTINVVTDFDHGLKNVFEKRPSIVCIQDQIGGVTGENVARHIQMLLGSSAPKFILLLTGNSKARLIKGLYEHIVDLSLSNETVAEDVTNILKTLLGDQWERFYIPPKLTPALVRSSAVLPEDSEENVGKLVEKPVTPPLTTPFPATSAIISASAAETVAAARIIPAHTPGNSEKLPKTDHTEAERPFKSQLFHTPPPGPFQVVDTRTGTTAVDRPRPALIVSAPPLKALPATDDPSEISFTIAPLVKPTVSASQNKGKQIVGTQVSQPISQPAPQAASKFAIRKHQPKKHVYEGMEPASEESELAAPQRQQMRHGFVIAALFAICAGGWHLVYKELQIDSSPEKPIVSSVVKKETPDATLPAVSAPVPESPPIPEKAAAPPVPSFISGDGRDPAYAEKNPGWERYLDKTAEFRVYSDSGQLCAVQALAVKGVPLSNKLLKTATQELTGSTDYRITSQVMKSGVSVESGTIRDEYEIKLYKKKGVLVAFVVSIKN
jgi:hypothetical protein